MSRNDCFRNMQYAIHNLVKKLESNLQQNDTIKIVDLKKLLKFLCLTPNN